MSVSPRPQRQNLQLINLASPLDLSLSDLISRLDLFVVCVPSSSKLGFQVAHAQKPPWELELGLTVSTRSRVSLYVDFIRILWEKKHKSSTELDWKIQTLPQNLYFWRLEIERRSRMTLLQKTRRSNDYFLSTEWPLKNWKSIYIYISK